MAHNLNMASNMPAWGGMFLSVWGNLKWQDVFHTVALGTIGTLVSFVLSILLQRLSRKWKK